MPHRRHILLLLYLLFTTVVTADDAAVMSALATAFSPAPSSWTPTTDFCKWEGITCDNSNRVTIINLSSKSLSGTLHTDINKLTQLKSLTLQRNSLSGPLPVLSDLSLLETLILDSNNFTLIPPNLFDGLNSLQTFSISDNVDLSPWVIPNDITLATNLQSFLASNAKITGSIPDIFDKLLNLKSLRLSYNNLTGSLPRTFGGSMIQNVWVNNQLHGLSGELDVISSMSQVSQLWLQANSFNGDIPDLSNCTILFDLQLRDNLLTGLVPDSLMSLPNLANVTLQNNKLQGPLPVFKEGVIVELGIGTNSFCLDKPGPCDPQVTALLEVARDIGYPMSLAQSWQGNDACQNWNYVSCDSSGKNVTSVSFGKQKFSGTISPAFANLTSLRTLSLNDNNFVGVIPEALTTLPNLVTFDVSNNNLSGKVPVFPPRVKFTNTGNALLGQDVPSGPSGSGTGSGNAGGVSSGSKKGSGSAGMAVGIVIGVVVFVVILLFVCYKCYYVKKRNQKDAKVKDPENGKEIVKASVMGGSSNAHRVSELQSQSSGDHTEMSVFEGGNVNISIDILREVTNNFSDENILGRGGFGIVYKGELHDGTKIAVKRMESGIMGTKGLKEFQAEIAVLTKVRHRHLVALLGYCINGNERLLVYEYMPQGTLSQHLFERKEHGSNLLSWKQRVSIALDVGRGVEYLHSLAQQSFIHRDLKPSNILLGDDMRAKVADFGLVKNAPDGSYSFETRLAGTFGYLAPEYAATGRVTTKVDVYAFGVVLMELIAGRRALDETMPDDKYNFVFCVLELTQCIIQFKEIPSMYVSTEVPAMSRAMNTIPTAVYWNVRGIIACAAQITSLTSMGHEYGISASELQSWELSTLILKINHLLEFLKKQLEECQRVIGDRKEMDFRKSFNQLFETIHIDNMKILKIIISPRDDILPLFDGATKQKVRLEVLRRRNVLLLISGLDMSRDELSILEQIYSESRHQGSESRLQVSRMDALYEVVWIPIVDPSIEYTEAMHRQFEEMKNSMPWYSVDHPSIIERAVIRSIGDRWHFRSKPILVVLDPQGRELSPNAIHMMWIWGSNAFPFTSAREEALWRDETWRLELLVSGMDPTILNWIRDDKYIFLYGGDDIEWIRKFTGSARAMATSARIPLEMAYVGRSKKRETVRRAITSIKVDKLSYCWEDTTLIWFFWTRIESMLFSKIQLRRADDQDLIMLQIKKLLSYDKNGSWALLCKGSQILTNGHGSTMLQTPADFDLWKEHIPNRGFDLSFTEYHDKLHVAANNCCRFEFPVAAGRIPEGMRCPECHRLMEKHIAFLCCHDQTGLLEPY